MKSPRPLSIRSLVAHVSLGGDHTEPGVPGAEPRRSWRSWTSGRLTVWYAPRAAVEAGPATHLPPLMLGDGSEWDHQVTERNLASGVPLHIDETGQTLVTSTSIVGLPPVFLYRGQKAIVLTSDIYLLAGLPGVDLAFDRESVLELGRVGHPLAHRTLFRDVSLVPGGGRLTLSRDGQVDFRASWELPRHAALDWPQFIEAQIEAFRSAVQHLDLAGGFLSLTAGLDTRTVFATLAHEQRLVPAATMTGPRYSLDARIAGRLCRAYGQRHHLITFDQRFSRELPRYVEVASRLSGGLASLGQAPEVYFYDQLGGGYTTRLSGNLGNQVGRGGTEGVSVRGAQIEILGPAIRADGSSGAPSAGHWLLAKIGDDAHATLQFILQQETAFTLVSNFPIGNHFAVQQTPYANRALIETLASRPPAGAPARSGSMFWMRMRDLRHRFLGEPELHSFQRTLVRRFGGFAARCPINWGWRPAGGVSPPALVMGAATLAGMYARARGWDGNTPFAWLGLPALHDFRESRRWLRYDLRELTLDSLGSRAERESGLFNRQALQPVLDEHFSGRRDHYETITLALDLALAHRLFCTRP